VYSCAASGVEGCCAWLVLVVSPREARIATVRKKHRREITVLAS
jgi:hypothetical protein